MNGLKQESEVRVKALSMLREELGGNNDYGFGEKIDAKDRAVQRVNVFIEMTNKKSESDLREFWIQVREEILYNI